MRNLLSTVVVAAALASPVAFAEDSPNEQAQKGQTDHTKMASAEFATLDKNKDGKLTQAEIPSDNAVTTHFSMLDSDKDGALSKSEFAKHHAMMK